MTKSDIVHSDSARRSGKLRSGKADVDGAGAVGCSHIASWQGTLHARRGDCPGQYAIPHCAPFKDILTGFRVGRAQANLRLDSPISSTFRSSRCSKMELAHSTPVSPLPTPHSPSLTPHFMHLLTSFFLLRVRRTSCWGALTKGTSQWRARELAESAGSKPEVAGSWQLAMPESQCIVSNFYSSVLNVVQQVTGRAHRAAGGAHGTSS